ncbi:MAG: hypothetical protein Q8Q06_00420 [bacterium]|nr:hypothetical protein [bacterium]
MGSFKKFFKNYVFPEDIIPSTDKKRRALIFISRAIFFWSIFLIGTGVLFGWGYYMTEAGQIKDFDRWLILWGFIGLVIGVSGWANETTPVIRRGVTYTDRQGNTCVDLDELFKSPKFRESLKQFEHISKAIKERGSYTYYD